jgi:hypothetical protein
MRDKKMKIDRITLSSGKIIKIGRDSVQHTDAKSSFEDILKEMRKIAKLGIMPPPGFD